MKFANKYIFPPFLTLFFFLLGGAIILVVDLVLPPVYDYLCYVLPDLFSRPNIIDEPERYESTQRGIAAMTVAVTTFIATAFAMRMDNKRFEHLTKLTEGMYTIPETTLWYVKSFWISDVVASVASPLLLVLPAYLVPMKYVSSFLPILWCGGRLVDLFSLAEALVISIGFSLGSRLILIPSTLNAWRTSWLSGSVD